MPSIAPIGQTAPFDRRQLQKRNAVEKHQCPVQRRLMLAGYTPISDKAAHCRLQNPIAQLVQFVRQLLIPLNAIAQRFRHFELSTQDGKRFVPRPIFAIQALLQLFVTLLARMSANKSCAVSNATFSILS